jgi:molybdate transport system permease protein
MIRIFRFDIGGRITSKLLALVLMSLFLLPISALVWSGASADVDLALEHASFASALRLSLKTSLVALGLTLLLGLPLSWWLATSKSIWRRLLDTLIEVPIVLPPAVMGVGMLQAFGRNGIWGPWLSAFGIAIPFTESAVVLAQLIVTAPFFVQSASQAFRRVEPDLVLVARSLGASETRVFWRVVMPLSLPGLVTGACLCWARALGEFGATLLFAGNRFGVTQTMPLAIFTVMESSVELAVVFSLALGLVGTSLLVVLRLFIRQDTNKP